MVQHKVKILRFTGECHCHQKLLSDEVLIDYKKRKEVTDVYGTRLYNILRPFLWYMRLTGMFFVHNHPVSYKPHPGFVRKFREGDRMWKAHSMACFLLHFLSAPFFILPVLVIGKFDRFTLNQFLFAVWQWQGCCVTMACHMMSRDPQKFSLLCETWEQLMWCDNERRAVEEAMARRTKTFLVIGLLVNILNTTGWTWMIFTTQPSYFPASFQKAVTPTMAFMMQVDYCTSHLFATCAWSLPYLLYANLVLSLRDTLILSNTVMDKALEDNEESRMQNPSNFILRFQHNIKVIEALSSSFGIQMLLKVVMGMLISCLNTYLLLFVCYDFDTKVQQFFWVAVDLSILIYIVYISSQINTMATDGYRKISQLNFKNTRGEIFQFANYFYRVTGPTIGISMAGFSTLTKGTLGTLIGTYLSYFFLIGQFQQPLPCDNLDNATTSQNATVV